MQDPSIPQIAPEVVDHYLAEIIARFDQSAGDAACRLWFEIAGQIVEVRIAGAHLVPLLTPALRHRVLPQPARAPDLTLRAFDSVATGIVMPRPIWSGESYTSRTGVLAGVSNERVLAAFDLSSGIFNMLDSVTGQGVYWIKDALNHPQYEMSTPFRVQLYWWMRTRGRYLVHGGAVCKPAGGLFLIGRGGSGKSTTALSSLAAGWQYLADDYVMFGLEPEPAAYNVYQSAKVTNEHFGNHFAHLGSAIHSYTRPVREKTMLMLNEEFPGRIASVCPLRAVIFPRIANVPSPRLKPIAPQKSLIGLAATTLQKLPGATPHDVRQMMALVQSIPNYALEIGGDPRQIPPVLNELLDSLLHNP